MALTKTNALKMVNRINEYVATLSGRIVEMYQIRFIEGNSLKDTAKAMGITREQVRQYEAKLFRKLIQNKIIKKDLKMFQPVAKGSNLSGFLEV